MNNGFIKLTKATGEAIYFRASAIVTIEPADSQWEDTKSIVSTNDDDDWHVMEAPEFILKLVSES